MRVARSLALARLAVALAPLLLLMPGPARAQLDSREAIALRNDIYRLQQEIDALRQAGQSGASSPTYLGGGYSAPRGGNDMVAQLLSQVQSLEDQVRDLRGQIQELQNRQQQQNADVNKRIDDLAFQMQNPGVAAGQPPAAAATTGTSPPPAALGATRTQAAPERPAAPPPRTAEAAMQEGNAALARRDYPRAEAAAREVLGKFRTSPRAYDAQYLLAQALAGQRDYPRAAIAYDDAYNRSRKGGHAQEALVGLAASLTAINEKKAACDTLAKLHAEFPREAADVRENAAQLHKRAGCK